MCRAPISRLKRSEAATGSGCGLGNMWVRVLTLPLLSLSMNKLIHLNGPTRKTKHNYSKNQSQKKNSYSSTICLLQVVTGGGPLNYVTNDPVPEFISSDVCAAQRERATTPGSARLLLALTAITQPGSSVQAEATPEGHEIVKQQTAPARQRAPNK